MNSVFNPLTSSFHLGTFLRVRVRMSYLLLCLLLVVLLGSKTLVLGGLICGIWLFSLLVHDLTQLFLAHRKSPKVNRQSQIILWPCGALEVERSSSSRAGRLQASGFGPFIYLAICLLILPFVWNEAWSTWKFYINSVPVKNAEVITGTEFLMLVMFVNFNLALVNLLPILPLDVGRWVTEYFNGRHQQNWGHHLMQIVAVGGSFMLMGGGLIFGLTWVVLLGGVLLAFSLYQRIAHLEIESETEENESFLGYDFSAGYTSLEKEEEQPEPPSLSWWEKRQLKKQLKQEAKKLLAEQQAREQLDQLLEKVHQSGMASLTALEQRTLKTASKQIRSQHQKST